MPNYEFRCEKCDKNFTRYRSFDKSNVPQDCPECGEVSKRVYNPAPVHFRGGGWGGK